MAEDIQCGKMTIRGEGTVVSLPDTAEISLTIEARGTTPAEASATAEKDLSDIKRALEASRATVKSLKTISMEVAPVFDMVDDGGTKVRKKTGYIARQSGTMSFPLKSRVHLKVISNIAKLCPDARTSLSFKLKNTSALERQCLKLAAKSAVSDAKVLARALDVQIVGIDSVSKDQNAYPVARANTFSAVSASSVEPVEMNMTLAVTIVFSICPARSKRESIIED